MSRGMRAGAPLRLTGAIAAVLAIAGSAAGSEISASEPSDLRTRVREELAASIHDLSNMVIHEKIVRFARCGSSVRRLDSYDALAEVIDGVERYPAVRRNGEEIGGVDRIGGLWAFGEIGALLRTTRDALETALPEDPRDSESSRRDYTSSAMESADRLAFGFPAASHRWYMTVDSRVLWLDFLGTIRIEHGMIRHIEWLSAPLPVETGIDRVRWTMDFGEVEIAGRKFTLPAAEQYQITRRGRGNRAEWNVTTFSGYARYGATASISFSP